MLRPPTALFCTVASVVRYDPNWLPQPIGQVPAFIIVESPAIHTLTGAAATVAVVAVPVRHIAAAGRAVTTPEAPVATVMTVAARIAREIFMAGSYRRELMTGASRSAIAWWPLSLGCTESLRPSAGSHPVVST